MKIAEIEKYYGKESADWVRDKIVDGTLQSPVTSIRLRNPKCKKDFLKIDDVVGYVDCDGLPTIRLPDHLRAFDIVRVEID